jgi:hypothetical protein
MKHGRTPAASGRKPRAFLDRIFTSDEFSFRQPCLALARHLVCAEIDEMIGRSRQTPGISILRIPLLANSLAEIQISNWHDTATMQPLHSADSADEVRVSRRRVLSVEAA